MLRPKVYCLGAIFLAVAPIAAQAKLTAVSCHFTTECLDADACVETDYSLSFPHDPAPKKWQLMDLTRKPSNKFDLRPGEFMIQVSDNSETFNAIPIWAHTHFGFSSFADDTTQRLLSVKDGVGRYTLHMLEEGISFSYLGTCAEAIS